MPATERLTSLDAFRGVVMFFMVLVNTPGDGRHTYAPLQHAEWHGWTPTDVVFPSFVWIAGLAITLVLTRRLDSGASRPALLGFAARRAAIIFALGLLVYAVPDFDPATFRILGVLQRIAICYLAATAILLWTGPRGQILWTAALLAVYWLIMLFAPVPGIGAGYLDVDRNFAHYIDRIALGAHNYANTKTWDPEGIVSTLPAIASALFGVLAGHVVAMKAPVAARATRLAGYGLALIAAGLVCDIWLPINKKLWTSSFALFMAGLDFVLFAGFLWIADGLGKKALFRPFAIMGMNAIVVYMVSELLETALSVSHLRDRIYEALFVPLASPMNASLLYAVSYSLLMFAIAYLMYRRGWFIRV